MAVNMNLRDLRNPQYTAVTGRKPINNYGGVLTAMGPSARASAEQDALNAIREKEFLQGVRQADATLLQNKTQYDTSLKQTKEQFDANQAMTQQQLDAAEKQATTSNIIQGTAVTAGLAYVAGKAGLIPGVGVVKPVSETLTGGFYNSQGLVTAAPLEGATQTTAGVTTLAGEGGTTLAGEGGATLAGEGGATLAGEGSATLAGTSGAAAAPTTAGTVMSVPGLQTAAAAYVGSQVGNIAAQKVGESIGTGGERERSFVGKVGGGAATGAAVGSAILPGPGTAIGAGIGATVGFLDWSFNEGGAVYRDAYNDTLGRVTGGTWICTEIKLRLGISSANVEHLSLLRRYAIKNHRAESAKYFKNGKLLVAAINAAPAASGNYEGLHDRLVQTCGLLVAAEQFEEAYLHYKAVVDELCEQYNVDLTIKENGRQ